ncbi:hypothetical protein F2P79_010162 [Pimephales promelas]|nr:hypothetical protein F2P79_010162 [Pimephales promelas]
MGFRAFSRSAPRLWNLLPPDIYNICLGRCSGGLACASPSASADMALGPTQYAFCQMEEIVVVLLRVLKLCASREKTTHIC